ncbi:MAG: helix-turn-helix domain-containing protein [Chloroflexi bacterium]|nr:helix-turn-helix domain-containing protein [Chloroflexota bacterium]
MVTDSNRIKKLRLEYGLSQERFARLLGVSLQTVRRWESGLSRPLPIISLKVEELESQLGKKRKEGGVPMSEREKPSREDIQIGLGGLFKGLGGLFDLVSEMAEKGKEELTRSGEVEVLGGKGKAIYGFSVKMGLGGKPVIEQFGNVKATEEGATVAEVREPLMDVFDEGDRLVVIVELPGVEDEGVHIEINGDVLALRAEGKYRKYSKELLLPSPVDAGSLERSYKNGILELRLGKKR